MRKKYWILGGAFVFFVLGFGIFAFDWIKNWNLNSDFDFFGWEKWESKRVSMIVGGDIMLSRGIGWWAKREGYERSFADFHPLTQFASYNSWEALLLFNLESPFAEQDNDKAQWGFLFRANSGNIQTLRSLKGQNQLLLSLANNHISNAWGAGYAFTKDLLSAEEIAHFGAGNSIGEAQSLLKIEKNWLHLCFQGYSYDGHYNRYGALPLARNKLDEDLVVRDLQRMRDMGCDVKILALHWGREYHLKANKEQRQLAYRLVDEGADLIVGGHSHIPWEREIYQGKPILYSLWNFLFDQDWGKKAQGGKFDYIWDVERNRQTVATYIPLMAELEIAKTKTGIQISSPLFKMAEINRGKFAPLHAETFEGILRMISLANKNSWN